MPGKGQFSRLTCKFADCPNPLHIYPNGIKATYCKAHLSYRKGKQRGGVGITGVQETVLRHLAAVCDEDYAFVLLPPQTSYRTILTLMERDWIVSGDKENRHYRITRRGLAVLVECDKQVQRRDGICFKCGVRPRHVNGNGKTENYCYTCERERCNAKQRALRRKPPTKPCNHCKSAPRHQYQPSDTWSKFCYDCDRMLRKERKRPSAKEQRERIRLGLKPVPICGKCKARPVVLCENSVAHYCSTCRPLKAREWKVKRMYARIRRGVAA